MKLKQALDNRSETEITASILDGLVKLRMGSFNRINNAPVFDPIKKFYRKQSKHTPPGISDIIGVYKSKYIAIEVKNRLEHAKVMKFWHLLTDSGTSIYEYQPKNKWEKHVLDQIRFIVEKTKEGGLGFFTCNLEHVVTKLGEV